MRALKSKAPIKRPKKIRRGASGLPLTLAIPAATFVCLIFFFFKPSEPSALAPTTLTLDAETVMVSVPTRAVAKGEKLSEIVFTKVSWPKRQLPPNFIEDTSSYLNHSALTALPKHLPIPFSALSSDLVLDNGVVDGIPEGMRAITVKVDAESAVEGWARSGNYVDVIVVRASKDENIGLEAKVVAENVRILSAGQSTAPLQNATSAPGTPSTVTLLTTQEDGLKIKTASNLGKLTFALRGKADDDPAATTSVNQKELLAGSSPAPLPKNFQGTAKGPDGKRYVLEESQWKRVSSENLATDRGPSDLTTEPK